jgi:hypothetical protein
MISNSYRTKSFSKRGKSYLFNDQSAKAMANEDNGTALLNNDVLVDTVIRRNYVKATSSTLSLSPDKSLKRLAAKPDMLF